MENAIDVQQSQPNSAAQGSNTAAQKKIENNTWIHRSPSKTVFVFVHGILSNSHECWLNKKTKAYWPSLVANDPFFEDSSVFVSGYTAGLGSGIYDVSDAAREVLTRLNSAALAPPPLSKQRLVFVCHSQGGIVVREMLRSFPEKFKGKKIGVVLCGSPSWGSLWATFLAPVVFLIRFRQASALTWGARSLVHLDRAFSRLLEKRDLDIEGMSLVETRGPFHTPKIVGEASATRYFSTWYRIPHSTHGEIVKPKDTGELSYEYLRQFGVDYHFLTRTRFKEACAEVRSAMDVLNQAYAHPETPERRTSAISVLRQHTYQALELADKDYGSLQVQLTRMLNATLDANGNWAFSDFAQADFASLRQQLSVLIDEPTPP